MSASTSDSGESAKSPRVRKKRMNKDGGKSPPVQGPTEEVNSKVLAAAQRTAAAPSKAVAPPATAPVAAVPATAAPLAEAPAAAVPAEAALAAAVPAAVSSSAAPSRVAEVAPKLSEVVKTASDIPKLSTPQVIRPPVGKKTEKIVPGNSVLGNVGPSYAQVSGSSTKSPFLEILGKYVAPRPPPSEAGKPRPKSDEGMQGVFNARWQDDRYGMHFEHIRGSAQSAYLKAISAVIPREDIFSFGLVGRGVVEVFATNLKSATKLMLEGIEVGGRHLSACPVTVKPTRVTFSRVPMRADHEDLVGFLKRFGTVHGKVRAIPLRVGDEGLGKGIFSTSREAFISLNKGCVLPSGFYLSIAGSRHWIGVETEAKCHACHQVGHFVAECPKRARKAADAATKETSAAAAVPHVAPLPDATPPLLEHPAAKESEETSKEATTKASSRLTPTRETSSDEEATTSSAARKKLTRRKPKSKASQEIMAPPKTPSVSVAPKRRHSDEERDSRSQKVHVVEPASTDCAPAGEVLSHDEEMELPQSGYESCNSTATALSLEGHFEVAEGLQEISPEKLRSVLERLHYKKTGDKILSILQQELGDPRRILPQLLVLQKAAKKKRNYAEASRCERLHKKVLQILAENQLDGSLRQ